IPIVRCGRPSKVDQYGFRKVRNTAPTLVVDHLSHLIGIQCGEVCRMLSNLCFISAESQRFIAVAYHTFTKDGLIPCARSCIPTYIDVQMISVTAEIIADDTCSTVLN